MGRLGLMGASASAPKGWDSSLSVLCRVISAWRDLLFVIPAKAGIHGELSKTRYLERSSSATMDSRLRGNDGRGGGSAVSFGSLLFPVCVSVCMLSGCATPLTTTSNAPPAVLVTPAIAAPLESFSVSGRFSAKRSDSGASGQFRYEQRGSLKTLELFTPASTPLARIDATAQSALLITADGATRSAASLSELLQTFIDIRVTDAQFSAWLQGLPSAGSAASAVERDAQSRLARFTEAGWLIEVSARAETGPHFPRRMRWVYTPETDTELRWVIDEFAAQ
jgi:outer membrane biogenesis lipoprotein LolB